MMTIAIAAIILLPIVAALLTFKYSKVERARWIKERDSRISTIKMKYPLKNKYEATRTIPFADMTVHEGAIGTVVDHAPYSVALRFPVNEHMSKVFWLEEENMPLMFLQVV